MKTTFKVVVIGAAGVGKTTFVRRLRGLEFRPNYLATIGVEAHPIKFNVKHEDESTEICLNFWDCAGQSKFAGLGDGYYIGADLGILIVGHDQKCNAHGSNYFKEFVRVNPNTPVLVFKYLRDGFGDNYCILEKYFNVKVVLGMISAKLKIKGKIHPIDQGINTKDKPQLVDVDLPIEPSDYDTELEELEEENSQLKAKLQKAEKLIDKLTKLYLE